MTPTKIGAGFHGPSGTSVLQHWGTVSTEGASTAGSLVPGSGTGELRGLRGEGKIAVDENGTPRSSSSTTSPISVRHRASRATGLLAFLSD
jgi:hypothetical protein